ncbi:MAG: ion channel DMI1 [Halospina sp.]
MRPLHFVDRLKFFLERQLIKGAFFQLMVVGLLIALISTIGGLLVLPLQGAFSGFGEALWWAFLRLTDPGYLGDDQGSWQRVVSTLLTISGYVVFMGTLVAIMTRWLISAMTKLERGLTPVSLKHHIAVLGWTSRTLPLITKLLGTTERMRLFLRRNDASRLRLVALADEVSAHREHQLRSDSGIGRRARQVILRSGNPLQSEALRRVACLDAAAVIIPGSTKTTESLLNADTETIKILLTIAAQAKEQNMPLPYVVAELQDPRRERLLRGAYGGDLELVAGDAMLSRFMVQTLRHPGLAEVFQEMMILPEGNELYIRFQDEWAGQSLGELAAARPDAIVLGVLERSGDQWRVSLNAPDTQVLENGDGLVLMAREFEDTSPARDSHRLPALVRQPAPERAAEAAHRRILLLGWNHRVPALIHELDSYPGETADITIVSFWSSTEREAAVARYNPQLRRVEYRHVVTDYLLEGEITQLNPEQYDSVMLLSSDRMASGEEADARAMVGYLQLRDHLARTQAPAPQVLLELTDPHNEALLVARDSEVFLTPVMLSHLLGQVALRRELRLVYDELFTQGGAEIGFRPVPDALREPGTTFAAIERHVASLGETALGIHRVHADSSNRHLELNPERTRPIELDPGDHLVVLGADSAPPEPMHDPAGNVRGETAGEGPQPLHSQ